MGDHTGGAGRKGKGARVAAGRTTVATPRARFAVGDTVTLKAELMFQPRGERSMRRLGETVPARVTRIDWESGPRSPAYFVEFTYNGRNQLGFFFQDQLSGRLSGT